MDLNKVMIIGRFVRDPEMRTTPSGQTVANFSVATSLTWKDQSGQQQSKTEYHNVVAWRRLAEIVGQYMKKGRQVYVEGRLQTRSWDDQAGQKKYRTEVIADNIIMLGSSGQTGAPGVATVTPGSAPTTSAQTPLPSQAAEPSVTPDTEISIEDIPF